MTFLQKDSCKFVVLLHTQQSFSNVLVAIITSPSGNVNAIFDRHAESVSGFCYFEEYLFTSKQ